MRCFTIGLALIVLIAFSSAAVAQDADCAGLLPARLVSGGQGRVLPPTPNNLREQPDADSRAIFQIPSDGTFEILGDVPVCADGYRWWHVRFTVFEGWTTEGDADGYWLAPAASNGRTVITAENAADLELVETLGFGLIYNVQWDGDDLILRTSTGRWRYSTLQPERMPEPAVIEDTSRLEAHVEGTNVQIVEGAWFGPDYHYLVTRTDSPTTLRLWDVETGEMMGVLPGLDFFTSEGRYIGFVTDEADDLQEDLLHLLELATLREVAIFICPTGERNALGVGDTEVSPDDRILVTVEGCQMCISQLVAVWDMVTGERLATLIDDAGDIWSIAFNTSGTRLAGANTHGEVRIWDTATWEFETLVPGNAYIANVEFSIDGNTLCYSDVAGRTFTWDMTVRNMPILAAEYCQTTTSTDREYAATLANDVLEVQKSGQILWTRPDIRGYVLTFSPDESLLIVSGGIPYIFDLKTGEEIATFPEQDLSGQVAFSPNGRWLAVPPYGNGWVSSNYPFLIIWDTTTQQVVERVDLRVNETDPALWYGIYDIVFNPNGDVLVMTGIGTTWLWNTNTWTRISEFSDRGGEDVLTAAFSPDGTLLALGGGSAFESYSSQSVVRLYGVG